MSAPATWTTTTIGDLFDIGAGKTVNAAARHGEPKHPFLRTANVMWGHVDLSSVDRMHFTNEELASKTLRPGDLLVCEGGEIGRAAMWNGEIPQCGFQNHLHRLRPKSADVVTAFFMYALQAGFTLHARYEGAGNKTTIPNLSRSRLEALEVPRPPPVEQRRIAAVLSLVRRAIENAEKTIAVIREMREAAAEQLYARGTHDGEGKESPAGRIPAHWDAVPIGNHAPVAQYGLSIRGAERGRVPILRMNCQRDGAVVFRDLQYVDIDDATLNAFRLRDGDILFNRTNSHELVGRTAIFHSQREAVFASYLVRLRVDASVWNPDFINYYLNRPIVQAELRTLASRGVSQSNINATKLKDFAAPVAPLKEQEEIVGVLSAIDRSVVVHEQHLGCLHDLWSSLLDSLMTGEIRVDKLDIDTSQFAAA